MPIRIRNAKPTDATSIAGFQIAMARETEDKQLDCDVVTRAVSKVFDDPQKGFYLVAVQDDGNGLEVVVGSLLVTYEWSDWRDSFMWYIQSVFVESEFRRQGAFKGMYQRVLELAKEANVMFVRLYVETENERAQSTYESLGMKRMPYYMYDIRVT